jgi:DNA-binding protein H-NS
MTKEDSGVVYNDIKKSVKELLEIRKEHIAEAEKIHKAAKEMIHEEAQEIWNKIKEHFDELEKRFESLEIASGAKHFISDKLDDISAVRELIEEKKTEIKSKKVQTTSKTAKKNASKPKNFLYWNPDNHKQAWNGIGNKPDWIKVDMDEIESHPRYIHQKHPRYDDLVSDHKHYGLVDK